MVTDSNIPPQEAARNQDVHVNKEAVKWSAFSSRGDARAPCCYCDWVPSSTRNSHPRWYYIYIYIYIYLFIKGTTLAYLHKMSITFIYIYRDIWKGHRSQHIARILYIKEIHGLNRIGRNTSERPAPRRAPDTPGEKLPPFQAISLWISSIKSRGVKNPRPFSRKYCKGLLSILQSNKYNLDWPVKDH